MDDNLYNFYTLKGVYLKERLRHIFCMETFNITDVKKHIFYNKADLNNKRRFQLHVRLIEEYILLSCCEVMQSFCVRVIE